MPYGILLSTAAHDMQGQGNGRHTVHERVWPDGARHHNVTARELGCKFSNKRYAPAPAIGEWLGAVELLQITARKGKHLFAVAPSTHLGGLVKSRVEPGSAIQDHFTPIHTPRRRG
jgi:hypothetical protein